MSPLGANWLNWSTDSNARCLLRSPGWMTSIDTYWSLSGSSPISSGQDIKSDGSLILVVLLHNQLSELVLIRFSTR
jgi:hypothetical protein